MRYIGNVINSTEVKLSQKLVTAPESAEDRVPQAFLRKYWREIHYQSHQWRWKLWCKVIREYSAKRFTRFSDKLVAVAGQASDLGRSWDNVNYLAGLWSYRLSRGLW